MKIITVLFLITQLFFKNNDFAQSVDHKRPVLEPYEIPNKIIVFTNWYYVRPGHFDWVDKNGKSGYANKNMIIDEYSAYFIPMDSPHGIELFTEKAINELSIIKKDKPWDKAGIRVENLIKVDNKYRLWGTAYATMQNSNTCYFESNDGINWTKPNLGLKEFNNSKKNNLLEKAATAIFIDPSAPKEERYKGLVHSKISNEDFENKYKERREWSVMATELDAPMIHAMFGAISPDGLTWNFLPDPIGFEHFDTQNFGYYDNQLNKYVFYVRTFMLGPRAHGYPYPKENFHQHMWRRSIGRIESDNFRELSLSEVIIEPTPEMHPADQFYTNCYTTVPNANDHHLMFPTIYNVTDDETDVVLFSSYNGKNWHRLPGPPIYETQEFGEADGGCVFAHPNLTERNNGDWILPYNGFNVPHKYPRGSYKFEPGMLIWPKGRLVGIRAKEKGEFSTVAFITPGKILKINAVTQRTGYIMIEVVGMNGITIQEHSFKDMNPIIGNHYKSIVTWKNSEEIGVETGEPVFLRFKLKMAKIYGLYFE